MKGMAINMKITVIHGQNHKGSTYHIVHSLLDKLDGEVTEFFLPKDFHDFCVGCTMCIAKNEKLCPHYENLTPLTKALDEADLIILASPVYVYHATGPMKTFLDHYGYRWMIHRPHGSMFRKQAVCISTAAGGGTKTTNKDMADSTFFWGIPKTYCYGMNVAATSWKGVSDKKKAKIEKDMTSLAKKIVSQAGNVRVPLKTKICFYVMRSLQNMIKNEPDVMHWQEMGWDKEKRPWKK